MQPIKIKTPVKCIESEDTILEIQIAERILPWPFKPVFTGNVARTLSFDFKPLLITIIDELNLSEWIDKVHKRQGPFKISLEVVDQSNNKFILEGCFPYTPIDENTVNILFDTAILVD